MKTVVSFLFCTLFLASLASAQETASLRAAVDVAFNNLVTSGKYATFSNKYGLNTTKPACSSPTAYPLATGLLKSVLDNSSITCCLFLSSSYPFWNDTSKTGFLFDIVNAILDEWKIQYGKRPSASWFHVGAKYGFFVDLYEAVNRGTCHMVVETTTVTAARSQFADFACPFTTTTSGFLRGPLDATRTNLTTLAALNDPSVKVGVLVGSVYDSPSGGVSKAKRVMYASDIDALVGVANQDVHASLLEAPHINSWLLSNPCNGCKYYDDGKGTQDYAFFVKKSSASTTVAGGLLVPLFLMLLTMVLAI